jgi:hypothetical protein
MPSVDHLEIPMSANPRPLSDAELSMVGTHSRFPQAEVDCVISELMERDQTLTPARLLDTTYLDEPVANFLNARFRLACGTALEHSDADAKLTLGEVVLQIVRESMGEEAAQEMQTGGDDAKVDDARQGAE